MKTVRPAISLTVDLARRIDFTYKMLDRFDRKIEYLRLSVIGSCNLNCIYCEPASCCSIKMLKREDILKIVAVLSGLGISKVRITGGEPLLRRDLEEIISGIAHINGITDIPMTTNGIGLAGRTKPLMEAGLTRINISLDTLKRQRFLEITKHDALDSVWKGILEGLDIGANIKINVVTMRGINDDEIDDFISLAKDMPLEVRFIELMPISEFGMSNRDKLVPNAEIIESHPGLVPAGKGAGGVAELFTMEGFVGKIGFISPITHNFCASCNRVRLTCDGKLRSCLGNNDETDLLPFLEKEDELEDHIRNAIYNKPMGHQFNCGFTSRRGMSQIGG